MLATLQSAASADQLWIRKLVLSQFSKDEIWSMEQIQFRSK